MHHVEIDFVEVLDKRFKQDQLKSHVETTKLTFLCVHL